MLLLLIGIGVILSLTGRWMFDRWFNHVSLYSAIWTLSVSLFGLQLLYYYRIDIETWLIVLGGWLAFAIGSATVPAARFALGTPVQNIRPGNSRAGTVFDEGSVKLLGKVLWLINIIALMDAAYQVHLVVRLVGSLENVLAFANFIYSSRVNEGLPGAIPYVGSVALAGCSLAGIYTSIIGRVKVVALLPLISVIVDSIVNMGRATMIIAGVLFLSGYLLNRSRLSVKPGRRGYDKFRRVVALFCVVVLLLLGGEVVRSTRGTIEGYAAATKSLDKLGGGSFITPSIYLYLTIHFGVLNEYLKKDREGGLPGSYSLAPMWRALSKLGFDTYVKQYQPFYKTPENANTGTYLRELHADYGLAGVLFGPYLLGLVTSLLWFRVKEKNRVTDLVILGNLFVVVVMSIFVNTTQLGYWMMSLVSGVAIALFIDRRSRLTHASLFLPLPG